MPVQGRLTPEEVEHLDALSASQSVPVERSAMITFILRQWLADHPKPKHKKHP